MFTAEKSKLFFNDPKFHSIDKWNQDSQEAAVSKIFAGQRQLKRSQVANSTLAFQPANSPNQFILLDFLQNRMNAFENKLVHDVEELFMQKERIKEKYSQAEDLYEKSNRKLKRLMNSVKTETVRFDDIEELEKQVAEIQRLYEENQFLQSMNSQIRARIEKKQSQLSSLQK